MLYAALTYGEIFLANSCIESLHCLFNPVFLGNGHTTILNVS